MPHARTHGAHDGSPPPLGSPDTANLRRARAMETHSREREHTPCPVPRERARECRLSGAEQPARYALHTSLLSNQQHTQRCAAGKHDPATLAR